MTGIEFIKYWYQGSIDIHFKPEDEIPYCTFSGLSEMLEMYHKMVMEEYASQQNIPTNEEIMEQQKKLLNSRPRKGFP
jgi:hypothetical protein